MPTEKHSGEAASYELVCKTFAPDHSGSLDRLTAEHCKRKCSMSCASDGAMTETCERAYKHCRQLCRCAKVTSKIAPKTAAAAAALHDEEAHRPTAVPEHAAEWTESVTGGLRGEDDIVPFPLVCTSGTGNHMTDLLLTTVCSNKHNSMISCEGGTMHAVNGGPMHEGCVKVCHCSPLRLR